MLPLPHPQTPASAAARLCALGLTVAAISRATGINRQTFCALLDEMQPRAKGSYAEQITFVTDRPGHDARYAIDPARIRTELGWRPSVTVEEGLRRTVRWYLDNEAWWRPLLERQGVGQRLGTRA